MIYGVNFVWIVRLGLRNEVKLEVNWTFCEKLGGRSSCADFRDMVVWRVDDLSFDGVGELIYMVHDG